MAVGRSKSKIDSIWPLSYNKEENKVGSGMTAEQYKVWWDSMKAKNYIK